MPAKTEDRVPGIPTSERIWTEYRTRRGQVFFITSRHADTSVFFIYGYEEGKAARLGKAASPAALEKRYIKQGGKV